MEPPSFCGWTSLGLGAVCATFSRSLGTRASAAQRRLGWTGTPERVYQVAYLLGGILFIALGGAALLGIISLCE